MSITASMVKELRERTGAGMMECKKALVEVGGDLDAAAEHLRKTGMAKADKKAGRVAAEGLVSIKLSADGSKAVLLEVNSETDFVAKDENFTQFVDRVADVALETAPADLASLMEASYQGDTSVESARQVLVAKIGENVQVRRFEVHQSAGSTLGQYSHGGRIGVLVDLKGGDLALAKDIAMHVAASNPLCLDENQVPKDVLDKEREIKLAQAQDSGKPPEIIEKMIVGQMKKYLAEVTLVGQAFVKDPDQSVGKLLAAAGAEVTYYRRYEVGEGIEKKVGNFAEEVMAQAQGN